MTTSDQTPKALVTLDEVRAAQRTAPQALETKALQSAYDKQQPRSPARADKTVFVLGKCFSCDLPTAQNTAYVSPEGTVRVYDSVANGATTCHGLTPAQEDLIRAADLYSTVRLVAAPVPVPEPSEQSMDDYDTNPERLSDLK